MRTLQALVLDDFVSDNFPVLYSHPDFNDWLGAVEELSIFAVTDKISGASVTLTVQLEESPDQIHWRNKAATPEIDSVSLGIFTEVFRGTDAGTVPTAGFARLKVSLTGSSRNVRLRIWVTGRVEEPI